MGDQNQHIVVQRTSAAYEVWAPCSEDGCTTRHRLVCTCTSRLDAEGVARAMDRRAAPVVQEDKK